jgi:hypothetical protein
MQALFADKQALGTATGTTVSTNVIDLNNGITTVPGAMPSGVVGVIGGLFHDQGRGADILIYAQITTAVAGNATSTLTINLIVDDDPTMASPLVIGTTGALDAAAGIAAGTVLKISGRLPAGLGGTNTRYLALNYVIATATMTAGNITAGIVLDRQEIHV